MSEYLRHIAKIPASVWFFVMTDAVMGMVNGIWGLKLNFFLVDQGMSAGQIGELLSFGTIVTALFAVVCGSLCDRFGYKQSLVVGSFLKAGAMLLTLSVPAGPALYPVRVVDGVANCLVTVCAYPYIFSLVEGEAQNTVYTLLFAVSMLSQFGGNVIAGMMANWGVSGEMILFGGTGMVVLVAILRCQLSGSTMVKSEPGFQWYLPRDKAIRRYLVYETFGYASYFMAYSMLNLTLRNFFGFSEGLTGWVLGGMTLTSGMAVLMLPVLTSNWDRKKLNSFIILGLILLYPIMAYSPGWSFMILAVATAALQCMMGALIEGPVLRTIPDAQKGGYSGLRLLLINIGISAGIFAAGNLINNATGIKILYLGVVLLLVLQWLIFVFGFQWILGPER